MLIRIGKATPWVAITVLFLAQAAVMPVAAEESAPGWQSLGAAPFEVVQGRDTPPITTALALIDERHVVAAGDDHLLRIWDIVERKLLARLRGHQDWVRTLAVTRDARTLLSAGDDHRILVWDLETFQKQATLAVHPEAIAHLALSPDEQAVTAVGFETTLRTYRLEDGKRLHEARCPCRDMRTCTFSPSGGILVGGGRNGRIRSWNPASGELLWQADAVHRRRIRGLAFAPGGQTLASVSEDRTIGLWNAAEGTLAQTIDARPAKLLCIAFVDGDLLAAGGTDNHIHLWRANGEPAGALRGHTGSVTALAAQGDLLVSSGFDASIRIWRRVAVPDREAAATSPAGWDR